VKYKQAAEPADDYISAQQGQPDGARFVSEEADKALDGRQQGLKRQAKPGNIQSQQNELVITDPEFIDTSRIVRWMFSVRSSAWWFINSY
jgi:hypothetical protein